MAGCISRMGWRATLYWQAVKVILNGKEKDLPSGITVSALLRELDLEGKPVAVERNREVVSRTLFEETSLEENDRIEIVHFVGGG